MVVEGQQIGVGWESTVQRGLCLNLLRVFEENQREQN
jgi:hypothetical protein